MLEKLKKLNTIKHITANRIIYSILVFAVVVFAYFSGERLAYLTATVLIVMPIISLAITALSIFTLHVKEEIPQSVLKNTDASVYIVFNNKLPFHISKMECKLFGTAYAVESSQHFTVSIQPRKDARGRVPFKIKYRGQYEIGLGSIVAMDFMGIFKIKRSFAKKGNVLALPQVHPTSNLPISTALVAESSSRFDIRDEDYSIISDIRPYVPTDSIKRVHWKLTAKRNEWMVKMYESNALNHISIILDTLSINASEETAYQIEDNMIERALGIAQFSLGKNMPVDFITTNGDKVVAKAVTSFDTIYTTAAKTTFADSPPHTVDGLLNQLVNESTGAKNIIIFTSHMTPKLYERIINALNRDNLIAIMYFPPIGTAYEYMNEDQKSAEIYKLLEDGGISCQKFSLF